MNTVGRLVGIAAACAYIGCGPSMNIFSSTEPVADFDRDGIVDYLYMERDPAQKQTPWLLIMRLGVDDGSCGRESIIARFAMPPAHIEIADYNHDRSPDIILYPEYDPDAYNGRGGTDSAKRFVLVNDCSGHFSMGLYDNGTLIRKLGP